MLTFAPGETAKTVSVTVLDDSHDDGVETLTLSNASGARIDDATATGTIENSDSWPQALMARFGRTLAVHVVKHVEERLQASRAPGVRGRFAGRELRPGMEPDLTLSVLSQFGRPAGVRTTGPDVHDPMSGSPGVDAASLGLPGLAGRSTLGFNRSRRNAAVFDVPGMESGKEEEITVSPHRRAPFHLGNLNTIR